MKPNKADIILGIQWGDEGKGRVVDYYARDYDIVARFGGGDNAGHTIKVGDQKIALRIVPSGVLQPHCELFVGGGTVVSLAGLSAELENLRSIGVDVSRIKISDRAHIVFPYHAAQDRHDETARGSAAIGTTGRGIGPAYVDKVSRAGITFGDLAQRQSLSEKIRFNAATRAAASGPPTGGFSDEEMIAQTLAAADTIASHVVDGVAYLHHALAEGKRILIEGAQGTLLDVGFGTYPYVTSSHTIAGGACTGLGIGPTAIGNVIGVVKAYATRVGAGPFPSELHDADADRLRENGNEFGTVTGRPRRCGWFDAVAARYAVQLNGLSAAIVTKLDVLSGFERIGIVTGYRVDGKPVGFEAAGRPGLDVDISYVDGWSGDIGHVRRIADLPPAALSYVRRLEAELAVPIARVSLGAERSELAQ
ncbi:MAG: adenylosuccinate synthase [Candidatus Eremiobacteraeota bacterium]|nr:adenylosuccinate synthase [Candidatus Eremiobacteraeota bacterium]